MPLLIYDKLDREKLKRDIEYYGSAGVPQEELAFWNQIDFVLCTLDSEAALRSEIHLLDAHLAKEKVISEEAAVSHVSSEVVGMVGRTEPPYQR